MKKIFYFVLFATLPLIVSGCTSNIIAKYDNYNEIFTGKSYYDPLAYRATINVTSSKNGAKCYGNANMYTYPIWQFNLTCSDGRAITGLLTDGLSEGTAFTNRNETITFSVAKKQSTIEKTQVKYRADIKNNPMLDNSKEHIKVIMQQ